MMAVNEPHGEMEQAEMNGEIVLVERTTRCEVAVQ